MMDLMDDSLMLPLASVWDSTRQAWYFWNSITQETTWTNPLEKASNAKDVQEDDASEKKDNVEEVDSASRTRLTDEEVALTNGIDPDLAYLDPVLYASEILQARSGKSSYSVSGAFDSRTGKFVPLSSTGVNGVHDPSRLSHANQADRQMGAFFDVEQYEEDRKRSREEREQEEAQGVKRKKPPTRKELHRFKERAKEKKAAKYAWLRD